MEKQKEPTKRTAYKEAHQVINDKIVEQLEKGIAPWRVPWTEAGVPSNLVSKFPYRGMNVMLLSSHGYERNVYITEKQLQELGGSIKAGERSHIAMYWKGSEGTDRKTLNYYRVYNVSQCAGILGVLVPELVKELNPTLACDRIVANMPKYQSLRHKENKAYYDPLGDYINLPKQKSFPNDAAYYCALFHQLIHATGHHTRLDRMGLVQMPEYGCDPYTLEELVAEIGACYLRSLAGIASMFDEHTDPKGWIPKLRKDPYLIFTASTYAQKAVDYILNVKPVEEAPKEIEEPESVTMY